MNYTTVKVKDIFKIQKGKKINTVFTEYKDGFYRYIQIEDLRNDENIKYCQLENNSVVCDRDDIIIAWDGANAGTISYNLSGVIGSTLALLRLKNNIQDVYIPYVGMYLRTKSKMLRELCTGATIPHISKAVLENIKIPLPSLEEQKRIAAVLEKTCELIEIRKQSIEKLNELVKGIFLELVGPYSKFYSEWPTYTVEQLALSKKGSMRTGPFGSDLRHSEFVDNGIAVLGIDNAVKNHFSWGERRFITKEKYEKLKRYTVYPKDIIITIMGTTGRSAVIPDDIPIAITTKHLATITVNKELVTPEFLSYCIHSHPEVLHQINLANKGAIMNGLNLGIIKSLKIKTPPIDIQNKFVEIYYSIEKQKQKMQESLVQLENNFNALLQRAFKGELEFNDTVTVSASSM